MQRDALGLKPKLASQSGSEQGGEWRDRRGARDRERAERVQQDVRKGAEKGQNRGRKRNGKGTEKGREGQKKGPERGQSSGTGPERQPCATYGSRTRQTITASNCQGKH